MWQQNYEPVGGSLGLSALVAAIPIVVLCFMLGVQRKPGWMAALTALGIAFILALVAYGMPVRLAVMSTITGAAYGLFPIAWIVFASIMLYRLAVDTGKFAIIKDSVGGLTGDRRLQALFIAFSLGAFIEGAAGFGAPVAVSGAMLVGLGFSPFYAAGICLMANTAPVAFGSIGIPVTTLAGMRTAVLYAQLQGAWSMHIRRPFRLLAIALPFCAAATVAVLLAAQGPDPQGDPLIAGFKSTYPASVSDAVELVTGRNGTMRYDMKLMTGANVVGRAVTALARPAPPDQATPALATKHSVEMIDAAKPGEVGVIVMEGTLDIAAMGNLMATAAVERGMAGMVLDGAIRDLWDVRRMGLTVYARSKSPRTAVGHYATVARNVPVECAGVTVRPGDIIVADEDGVVVVPQERAAEVLKRAQAIDQQESGMFPFIREFKSLSKAIAKFNRI